MQISSISAQAPSPYVYFPQAVAPVTQVASTPPASNPPATPPVPQASTIATQQPYHPAQSQSTSAGVSSAGAARSTAVTTQESSPETVFNTTVGGQVYVESVDQSDGTYTASINTLAGAVVSASSLDAAENGLTLRIDELV